LSAAIPINQTNNKTAGGGLPGSKLPSFASPKEGDPGLPPLRGSLRYSDAQAAAELALRAQT